MKHTVEGSRADYIIQRDDQLGRIEYSRVDEEAPQHIVVSLQLIQRSNPELLTVGFDSLTLLNDPYRIVGWDAAHGGLECELIANEE